jgi:tetratricopeptide (TPR) repeat protein
VWAFRAEFVDRETYLAARAAERDAASAFRWASANHDPLEQSLAVAYADLILSIGRFREGGAITGRLIASPPSDPKVRCYALLAHSLYLNNTGRHGEARRLADEAYHAAPDRRTRSHALLQRGLSNFFGGHAAEAVADHAQATALARELYDDPALLAGALVLAAQALIGARCLDEAAARLDEARTGGSPVDANILYYLDTDMGDLALADGRLADALEPYARSLEQSLADGWMMQIKNDLFSVAEALAALGHETESLEGREPLHRDRRLTRAALRGAPRGARATNRSCQGSGAQAARPSR